MSRRDSEAVYAERLYDLFHRDNDYTADAEYLRALVTSHRPSAATWLDVACGTGHHLAALAQWFEVAGVDVSAPMLAVASRHVGLDVRLHQGSFTSFELEQRFDVVSCLSSSICHAETSMGLGQAVARMGAHVSADGLLLIERYFHTSSTTPTSVSSTSPTATFARASITSAAEAAPAPSCMSTTCWPGQARSSTTISTSESACSPTRTTRVRLTTPAFGIASG